MAKIQHSLENSHISYDAKTGHYYIDQIQGNGKTVTFQVGSLSEALSRIKTTYSTTAPSTVMERYNGIQKVRTGRQLAGIRHEVAQSLTSGQLPESLSSRSVLTQLEKYYPKQQGWEYKAKEGVTDFNKYASFVDLVVHNTRTNETHLVNIGAKAPSAVNTTQLSFQAHMYELSHPNQKVSGVHMLRPDTNNTTGHFYSVRRVSDRRLNDVFYPGFGPIRRNVINTDKVEYDQASLGGHLPQYFWHKSTDVNYKRPIVALDIETGHDNQVLSVAAIKFAQDKSGSFQVLDTFERYFVAKNRDTADYKTNLAIHHLTPEIINKLRRHQAHAGLKYDKYYSKIDAAELRRFIGDTGVITGHNIAEFDLPILFGPQLQGLNDPSGQYFNSTIDTLVGLHNEYGMGGKRLGDVFQTLFGKTMEQAGLPPHNAMSDTIAQAMITEHILKSNTALGQQMRYVLKNPGVQLAPKDKYIGSVFTTGRANDWRTEKYMDLNESMEERTQKFLDNAIGPGMHVSKDFKSWIGDNEDSARLAGELGAQRQSSGEIDVAGLSNSIDSMKTMFANNLGSFQEIFSGLTANVNQLNIYKRGSIAQTISHLSQQTDAGKINSLFELYDISSQSARNKILDSADVYRKIREYRENTRISEHADAQRQSLGHKIDVMEARGRISPKQASELRLIDSYQDLSTSMDNVLIKNEKLTRIYNTLGSMPLYNFDRWVGAIGNQWGGIKGSARGVVPDFALAPVSRFGDAFQNMLHASYEPYRRGWNVAKLVGSAAGGILGGALTANPMGVGAGMAVGNGAMSLLSNTIGNYGEAKINITGQTLQKQFNLLGGTLSILTSSFKLLSNTLKLVTGLFSGIGVSATAYMASGLNNMNSMGFPLTSLSGVSVNNYTGSFMMDRMLQQSRGTTNTAFENFARQKSNLMSMGVVDSNRLVAAARLGILNNVYFSNGPTDKAYMNSVNHVAGLIRSGAGNSQDIMNWVEQVDPTMSKAVQKMLSLNLTDVADLMTPKIRGIRYRNITEGEQSRFDWDQYEYGAVKQSMGFSKMRITDVLWRSFGKTLYGGLNDVMDELAQGNWKTAFETAKKALSDTWSSIKQTFFGNKDLSMGDLADKIFEPFQIGGKQFVSNIIGAFTQGALSIVDIWSSVIDTMIDSTSGLMTMLSSVKIDWWKLARGESGFLTYANPNQTYASTTKLNNNLISDFAKGDVYIPRGSVSMGVPYYKDRASLQNFDELQLWLNSGRGPNRTYTVDNKVFPLSSKEDVAGVMQYFKYKQQYYEKGYTDPNILNYLLASDTSGLIPQSVKDQASTGLNTTGMSQVLKTFKNDGVGLVKQTITEGGAAAQKFIQNMPVSSVKITLQDMKGKIADVVADTMGGVTTQAYRDDISMQKFTEASANGIGR